MIPVAAVLTLAKMSYRGQIYFIYGHIYSYKKYIGDILPYKEANRDIYGNGTPYMVTDISIYGANYSHIWLYVAPHMASFSHIEPYIAICS